MNNHCLTKLRWNAKMNEKFALHVNAGSVGFAELDISEDE